MLDFLGIGAQKAATTWMYTQLASHPGVSFPAGKEVHYWDGTKNPDGSAWQTLFEPASDRKQGEITPAYALLPHEMVSVIRRLYPALRVFFSIRNPIERSWAHARMMHENGKLSLDDLPAVFDFLAGRQCVRRCQYAKTIERWRSVFGPDQFRCVFFDEVSRDPRAVLIELAEHIGVDATYFREKPAPEVSKPVFAGIAVAMPDVVRERLTAMYAQQIDELGRLVDRDLSSWTVTRTETASFERAELSHRAASAPSLE